VLSRCPDQPELFAFGDQENGIEVWNLRTRQRLRQLDFNHRQVWGLALAPGGQRLAASSFDSSSWQDPTIKVWDGESDTPKTFAEFAALCLEFSPDGQLLIAAGGTWRQGRVAFFDVTSGTRKHDDLLLPSFAYGTVLDPEGRVLAIAHADSNVILWDLTQQKTLYKIRLAMPVVTLAFSPDAQTIAIGGWDNTVTLWHRTTGQRLGVLKTSGVIMSLEFSDDGDILAAGSGDRTVTLWYRDGHKQVHRIQ
jgi:WD40 repeat protein